MQRSMICTALLFLGPIAVRGEEVHDETKCLDRGERNNNCCGLPGWITCADGFKLVHPAEDVFSDECPEPWRDDPELGGARFYQCVGEPGQAQSGDGEVQPDAAPQGGSPCAVYDPRSNDPTNVDPVHKVPVTTAPPEVVTEAPKLVPKYPYTLWVEDPFMTATVHDCRKACEADHKLNGDCHEFEYDFNYLTCHLYKEEYINPKGSYADFLDGEKWNWVKANAVRPYYFEVGAYADFLLNPILKEFWPRVKEADVTPDYSDQLGEGAMETYPEKVKEYQDGGNLARRQEALIQMVIEDFDLTVFVAPEDEMRTLIDKLMRKNDRFTVTMAYNLVKRMETKLSDLKKIQDAGGVRPDYVGPRRLLSFGEASA